MKRRRKSRKSLTKTKVLRFTRRERLLSNDRDKKKILARKFDTDKPIILRTRKLSLTRIKKPIVVKDNDYYDYKPIYDKVIELNNNKKKSVCEKRKVRRGVILARGFGGAHHKKRNLTDDSKVRC